MSTPNTGATIVGQQIKRVFQEQTFPVVDANDLLGGIKHVTTASQLSTLTNVLPGDLATAEDTQLAYQYVLVTPPSTYGWQLYPQGITTAALAANNGASLVGYTEGGALALTRTVQSRLRDTIYATDFMAGSPADDSAAWAACLAEAATTKRKIVFPKAGKTYIVSPFSIKTGNVPAGIEWNGCTLQAKAGSTGIFAQIENPQADVAGFWMSGSVVFDANNTCSEAYEMHGCQNAVIAARIVGINAKKVGLSITDGHMNTGSAVLTSASAPFAATMVGSRVRVPGAGSAGADLVTTIAVYNSTSNVTLATANASGGTVSGSDVTSEADGYGIVWIAEPGFGIYYNGPTFLCAGDSAGPTGNGGGGIYAKSVNNAGGNYIAASGGGTWQSKYNKGFGGDFDYCNISIDHFEQEKNDLVTRVGHSYSLIFRGGYEELCNQSYASNGSALTSVAITGLSGTVGLTTATAHAVAHGLATNQIIDMSGASDGAFNVTLAVVTVTDADHFTYTTSATIADASPTGPFTCDVPDGAFFLDPANANGVKVWGRIIGNSKNFTLPGCWYAADNYTQSNKPILDELGNITWQGLVRGTGLGIGAGGVANGINFGTTAPISLAGTTMAQVLSTGFQFFRPPLFSSAAITYAASIDLSAFVSPFGILTLTANAVVAAFPAATTGKLFFMEVIQSGGSNNITSWPGNVSPPGTITATNGKKDLFGWLYDGSKWMLVIVQQNQ